MAKIPVTVSVSLPNGPNGPVVVTVDPWTAWTSGQGPDHVEWVLSQVRGDKIRALEMRIVTQDSVWPFEGKNPGWGKKLKTGNRKLVKKPYTLPYAIEVTFKDDQRAKRQLTIDPDLVIEY